MRIGIFCTYENPQNSYAHSYAAQTRLVKHAERIGFEEAWVAEHHFDPDAPSPSIMPLIAYLAGATKRIRIGSAAVLLAFRNPIQVAEDVASIDLLSGGRFDFGVAKGGPFDAQNRHFGVGKEDARGQMLEALSLVNRLLYEDEVSFSGRHYTVEGVRLAPKPVQQPVPTYLATSTPEAIAFAAQSGFGVMAASAASLERSYEVADAYWREVPRGVDGRFVLARFYFAAPTRAEALAQAEPYVRRFAERMRGIFLAQGKGPLARFEVEGLLARSLVGSYEEVAEKTRAVAARTGATSLLLKPACLDTEHAVVSLSAFATRIRPALDGAVAAPGRKVRA